MPIAARKRRGPRNVLTPLPLRNGQFHSEIIRDRAERVFNCSSVCQNSEYINDSTWWASMGSARFRLPQLPFSGSCVVPLLFLASVYDWCPPPKRVAYFPHLIGDANGQRRRRHYHIRLNRLVETAEEACTHCRAHESAFWPPPCTSHVVPVDELLRYREEWKTNSLCGSSAHVMAGRFLAGISERSMCQTHNKARATLFL